MDQDFYISLIYKRIQQLLEPEEERAIGAMAEGEARTPDSG